MPKGNPGVPKGPASDAAKAHMREAQRKRWERPEERERNRERTKAQMQDPAMHELLSARAKERFADPAARAYLKRPRQMKGTVEEYERRSRHAKRMWARPEHRARMLPVLHAVHPISKLEDRVALALEAAGVAFIRQQQIGWYHPDFYLASLKLAVEVDGCYWHACPRCGYTLSKAAVNNRNRDIRRDSYLRNRGYAVLHVVEHDMTEAFLTRFAEGLARLSALAKGWPNE